MSNISRIIGTVGLIFLLIGIAGIGTGSYKQAVNDCKSGSAISISPLTADNDINTRAEPIPFNNLSPTEQRIFLEAYTSTYNISEVYQKWPTTRFGDIRAVTYQHRQYYVSPIVTDCGISIGKLIKFGGIVSSIIGLGFLGIIGIRQIS